MAFFPCYPLNEPAERSQNRSRFTSEVTKQSYEVPSNSLQTVATVTFYFSLEDFNEGPFGELIRSSGTPPCNFGFSTKYRDNETGLNYYGYRYYSSGLGRWLGRDPLGEDGGLNLVAFNANNGVNSWDVNGLSNNEGAWEYGLKWVLGKAPDVTNYVDGDYMLEHIKHSATFFLRKLEMRGKLKAYCFGRGSDTSIQLGNELARINPIEYAATYFWKLLFNNPADAFVGSYSGGQITTSDIDCCKQKAKMKVHIVNNVGTKSLTHAPPTPNKGYGQKSLLGNDALGKKGLMHTTTQIFDWEEDIEWY